MLKLLTSIGTILGTNKEGKDSGIISLIKEKTGKISFKRSAAIVIITTVAMPDVTANGLTWMNVVLLLGCIAAPALTEIFKKD